MDVGRLAIGGAVVALAVAGCGSKEPPPFKEVQPAPQPTTTSAAPTAATPAGGTIRGTIVNLGPRYNRVFAELIDARDVLGNRGDAVAAAATDAQALVDRVAAGYTPPSGAAPQVLRLRDALDSFSNVLHTLLTSNTQLTRLAAQLQVRSSQLSKRRPAQAAALLTAKEQVDAAIAEVSGLDRAVVVARTSVGEQLSNVSLNSNALRAAVLSAGQASSAAVAKIDDAVDRGFRALVTAG